MINIERKSFIWIIVFLLLLPSVFADFFPTGNVDLEGVYNITNGSFIFADNFCFNDGRCFAAKDTGVIVSSWGLALIVSILGTAFLFVYIALNLGTATENLKRPITVGMMNLLKGLLILSALIMPILAITANDAIWSAINLNATSLTIYSTGAYRIALYIPIAVVSLLIVFAITEAILSIIERKRE